MVDGYVCLSFIFVLYRRVYTTLSYLSIYHSYDTYFFTDLSRHSDHFTTLNPSSLGTVIREFFVYYGGVFDFKTDVISVRQRRVKKEDKGWEEDLERDHNHMCIEVGYRSHSLTLCLSLIRSSSRS
jgi:DNA polymerase sigma